MIYVAKKDIFNAFQLKKNLAAETTNPIKMMGISLFHEGHKI